MAGIRRRAPVGPFNHPRPILFFLAIALAAGLLPYGASLAEQSLPTAATAAKATSPVDAARSLDFFRLTGGLRIELAASEPQVIDPVSVRFDERGRMWVVEMRDYPHGPVAGEPPKSQIKILEDRDGDGRFETARVFADKLLFVTGVQPWRGGAIVTLAGQVAFMPDADGDGRADRIETWFTGFAEENAQLRANHPTWALDNHIYVANGLRGGSIVDARQDGQTPLSISGMDFRFDPQSERFEAVSGVGQFGLTFDDYGNRFVCSNRNPLKHIVLEDRYLRRNRLLAVSAVAHDVARSAEQSRVYPISQAWTTSTLHAGQFTAACGVEIYRGDALPEAFNGNAFTCEPTGNLVHREVLEPAGATFQSHAAREGVEFLASTDSWFRPVDLETGPDGALYVVDMYRAVIEHPQFMPDELKQRPDLLDGNDRGRIYRIVSEHQEPRTWSSLSGLSAEELVEQLQSSNVWRRETAARLLVERQDRSVQTSLARMAANGKHPTARTQALWTLNGLDVLSEQLVSAALSDPHPRVREQAVKLAEAWLEQSPALRQNVARLASDADPRVRFQVALSLAPATRRSDIAALHQIAIAGAEDPWTRQAVVISSGNVAAELVIAILQSPATTERPTDGKLELIGELAMLVGRADSDDKPIRLLRALAELPRIEAAQRIQRVVLHGLAKSVSRRTGSLESLLGRLDDADLRDHVRSMLGSTAEVARDISASNALRIEAIDLLAYQAAAADTLLALALDDPSQEVRQRAIGAINQQTAIEPWRALLAKLPRESPALRRAIVDAMLARPDRTALLLDEIAAGRLKVSELDRAQTSRLIDHRDSTIRQRAAQLFADAVAPDRQQVLAAYQASLPLDADARQGREVFRKNCATCHRIGDVGVNVAPDIADSRTKTPSQLLTDILQPNRAIDSNYLSYSVATFDGRVLTGILVAENANSITLQQPEAQTLTLLRSDIEELRSSGLSLMPDGLEKNISLQDMANLISFIKNWRYLDSETPIPGIR